MDLTQATLWLLAILVLGRDFALTAGPTTRTPQAAELPSPRGLWLWRLLQIVFLLAALAGPPILVMAWLADVGVIPCDDALPRNASPCAVGINALQLLGYAVLSRAWEDGEWTFYRRLLRAQDYRGPTVAAGTLVRAVGYVQDRTPVETPAGPAAFAVLSETEHIPGSDPNIVNVRLLNEATFQVQTAHGRLELQPTLAVLRHAHVLEREGQVGSGNKLTQTTNYLPLGSKIFVVGRVQGTLEGAPLLAGSSEEPLLLFVLAEGQDVQALAESALAAHRANTVLLACLAVAALALGFVAGQHFPPLHLPSSATE